MAAGGYENSTAAIVAKLLLRNNRAISRAVIPQREEAEPAQPTRIAPHSAQNGS
jgi:hypothetical protein